MTPCEFIEANCMFNPPKDLDESQCQSIHAYRGLIKGGNLDGASHVIVAWRPSNEEREAIASGSDIYLSVIGGLPPHYVSTSFKGAYL